MSIYRWILLTGFSIFSVSTLFHLIQIIRCANIDDLSTGKGPILPAVAYSLTGALSPLKKETAYLHLPTYISGILYHLGTFLAFLWLIFHFFSLSLSMTLKLISFYFLIITSLCGVTILIKRIVNPKLRHISTPDDYFSNLLTTGFQLLSAFALIQDSLLPSSFIYAGILFLYIPIGKLKHVIYFFISRLYLGLFYGKRGVWPPKKQTLWETRNL